jgi:hypothetical protein
MLAAVACPAASHLTKAQTFVLFVLAARSNVNMAKPRATLAKLARFARRARLSQLSAPLERMVKGKAWTA